LYEIAGRRYPGVTTILSATKPLEARQALQQWRDRMGADAAQQISNRASSAGTRLHKQIARFLQGDTVEISADLTDYWESISPVLNAAEETLLVEGAVWHDAGYVGFPDAVVAYQNQVWVCDWKTALKPKRLEWVGDYCLQVAAYLQAIEQVYEETGIDVAGALIAIALTDAPAQTFWLTRDEIEMHWQSFQSRLRQYQRRTQFNSAFLRD
jgi:genome maintenance exonuclease 1